MFLKAAEQANIVMIYIAISNAWLLLHTFTSQCRHTNPNMTVHVLYVPADCTKYEYTATTT